MNDDLSASMTRLSEPAPPASLKATVMARIARDLDRQDAPAAVATARVQVRNDRLVWVCTFAGLAVVLCAIAYGWLAAGSLPDLTSPRVRPVRVALIPDGPPVSVIGLGLLVYLWGLLAPLRSGSRT